MTLNTTFLLLAQYNGKAVIPLEDVRRDRDVLAVLSPSIS